MLKINLPFRKFTNSRVNNWIILKIKNAKLSWVSF